MSSSSKVGGGGAKAPLLRRPCVNEFLSVIRRCDRTVFIRSTQYNVLQTEINTEFVKILLQESIQVNHESTWAIKSQHQSHSFLQDETRSICFTFLKWRMLQFFNWFVRSLHLVFHARSFVYVLTRFLLKFPRILPCSCAFRRRLRVASCSPGVPDWASSQHWSPTFAAYSPLPPYTFCERSKSWLFPVCLVFYLVIEVPVNILKRFILIIEVLDKSSSWTFYKVADSEQPPSQTRSSKGAPPPRRVPGDEVV